MDLNYYGNSTGGFDYDESDDEMTIVYAERDGDDADKWNIFHAEDRELIDWTHGTQHDLVEYCIAHNYDLRDCPL